MRFLSRVPCLWFCLQLPAADLTQLGRQLFFDKRLSADGSLSCGSCHRPDRAFSEPRAISNGIGGALGKFNAPTVLNLQSAKRLFWDGRARSLEQQVEGPLLSEIEMGNTRADLEQRLEAIPEYRQRFKRSFGDGRITLERIAKAIAAYERTLASSQSLYDDWRAGKRDRWTSEHELGRILFFDEAGCARCHSGQNFSNQKLMPNDQGALFKVPSLREAARTAPYMHDGSIPTLSQVLERHQGAARLDDGQRRALLRFIEALSGEPLH